LSRQYSSMPQNKDFALRTEIIDKCLRNRYRQWTLQNLIDAVNEKLLERYNKKAQISVLRQRPLRLSIWRH